VIAVGATTSTDKRAVWSNFGECVDIHAPGYGIRSTWRNGSTKVLDGTSMAAPFVAGTTALYLSHHPGAKFSEVRGWLVTNSTKGKITGLPTGTPNRLLFKRGL
jgi:subtilisin family serine protease